MKRTLLILIISCFLLTSCVTLDVPLYGTFRSDPGVRVYESEGRTIINITHRPGSEPRYDAAKIVREVME